MDREKTAAQHTLDTIFFFEFTIFRVNVINNIVRQLAGRQLVGNPVHQAIADMQCLEPYLAENSEPGTYHRFFDPTKDGSEWCKKWGCRFANTTKMTQCPRYKEALAREQAAQE